MKEVMYHQIMSVQGSSSLYVSGETSEYNEQMKCSEVRKYSLYLYGSKKSYFLKLDDNKKRNRYLTKLVNDND